MQTLINLNRIQFGFTPRNGRVDAIFITRKKNEYEKKDKKLHTCFLNIKKTFG